MDTQELLKKIKRIEIKAKGVSKQLFAGQYQSAFKGMGMEFAEVRQYYPGDETRAIDWNVTARFNEPFVKVFEEERELTVMFLVDCSRSTFFGSKNQRKKDYMVELCATLAFSAIQNNDKVGVIFFSDTIEKYIPPRKGKQHVLRIIRDLVEFEPKNVKTNLAEALLFFTHAVKRHCTAFVVSDFMDVNYQRELRLASRKHDVMTLRVQDVKDVSLPSIGWKYIKGAESEKGRWVNTSSKKVQEAFDQEVKEREDYYQSALLKSGTGGVSLVTAESFVKPLQKAFKQRSK